MEGGVFEDERIIGIGNKRGRGDEKQGDKMGRLEKRPSGIVVIDEYSYSGDEMINGVKYEEEKTSTPTSASTTTSGGGLYNQLITNLVSSPKSNGSKCGHGGEVGGDDEVVVKKDDGGVVEENGGLEDNKENAGGGGGGGGGESIIDNIVAKLPRTLSEYTGTVPEPDEASILLHSFIHD